MAESLKRTGDAENFKYELHKWKKQLLVADILIIICIIIFLGLYSSDYVLIAAYLLLIPYLFLTKRQVLFYHLIVASLIALVWMIITKEQYAYNGDFLNIFGINSYSLFVWAIGLFLIYVIYSHYEYLLKEKSFTKKFLLFIAFYIPILISAETVAYHLLNIRNIATASFPGLPICDCLHAPRWMQVSYFAMGPIFFSICYVLKLENPHYKPKEIKFSRN